MERLGRMLLVQRLNTVYLGLDLVSYNHFLLTPVLDVRFED